jgi:60 kDa SS-A/Ro ribonucleoprotein
MTTSYARHLKNTPQTESLPGQVQNSAGGYCYKLDPFARLQRFLILGTEGGTYYATEGKLTRENANCVLDCAKADPVRTVNRIVDISVSGRAPKNDPAIFALAILACNGKLDGNVQIASGLALAALPRVCRTGTHLFQFVDTVNEFRGWGRGLRRAIANWYTVRSPDALAMQVTKYAQRGGWSHRDLLRLSHPKSRPHNDVFQYVAQREKWLKSKRPGTRLLVTVEEAKTASIQKLVKYIREEGLVREHIPTERLDNKEIWAALLEDMPATAMLRNLAKMTSIGLLAPLTTATATVVRRLRDPEYLRENRIHPFSVLLALRTYSQGHGHRGSLTWEPVPQITAVLDEAFYLSFGMLTPTNKRFLLGIDVSGSMSSPIMGTNVPCSMAAGVMAMVAMKTEPACHAFGFTDQFTPLNLNPRMNLENVCARLWHNNFGRTDCSVPMTHALKHRIPVDVFCVYTDNETYAGRQHPSQALREYRNKMGIDAKLVVFGMTATNFTIADPNDPGMLDVVGFDASAPEVVAEFVR